MVSLTFARNYAYAYWGSVGALLAFWIPIDPTIVGPKSMLGPLVEFWPAETLDEVQIWLAHCWGVTVLGIILGNYWTPGTDSVFVKTQAILAIAWYPACAYALAQNFGFFWKYFFPVIHTWNTYVYVSGSGFLDGGSITKKFKNWYFSLQKTVKKVQLQNWLLCQWLSFVTTFLLTLHNSKTHLWS